MRNSGLKRLAWLAAVVGALTMSPAAQAQRYVTLVDWDQSWQYVEQFGVNLGTVWRTNTYNDAVSPWLTGQGIFANETAAYPAPFLTTLSLGPNPGVNNTTNYYFRTHFTYYASNFVAPLTLWASNAVDDGCVVYLNGMEAGRIRVPGNQTAATYASGTIAVAEGTIEPFQIATNLLRIGDNVLAVEVHQVNATSSDIAFGLKLAAIVPTAIVITTQPVSQSVAQGSSVTLSVTTTGGPGSFQWQTNNGSGVYVNIPGATSTNYSFVANAIGATSYRFTATNGAGGTVSAVATVTVASDTVGPMILSACVLEEPTRTNRIELSFDENLYSFGTTSTVASTISPPILTNNFRLVMFGSNVVVPLTSSTYTPAVAPSTISRVTLTVAANAFGTNNWFFRSNYYILLNNIRDVRTNVIAPNTIVSLCWPLATNIFTPGVQSWYYHDSYVNTFIDYGIDIYTNAWWTTNYNDQSPVPWAGPSSGLLYWDQEFTNETCFLGLPISSAGGQDEPTLLRSWFVWPPNTTTNADLRLAYAADDAAAFYLNGQFLFKDPAFPAGTIAAGTRATTGAEAVCKTNLIRNVAIRPGSNLLAVAVAQYRPPVGPVDSPFDFVWTVQMDAISYQLGPMPAATVGTNTPGFAWSRTNRITVATTNSSDLRFVWPTNAYGYALEYATNVIGPWSQVQPGTANPFLPRSIVNGLRFTSADNSPERDPLTFRFEGRLGPTSPWVLIVPTGVNTNVNTSIPVTRLASSSVSFSNSVAYTQYRITFPTIRTPATADSMQIAEVAFIDIHNTGSDVSAPGNSVMPTSANHLAGESAEMAIDDNINTKYRNLDKFNAGFIFTPAPTIFYRLRATQ